MKNDRRTKKELIRDLNALRKQIKRLEIDLKKKNSAEEQGRSAHAWQEALAEGSRDAIIIGDIDSRIIAANTSACTKTGYSRKELLKKHIHELYAGKDPSVYQKYYDRVIAGEAMVYRAILQRIDGKEIELECNSQRIDIAGRPYVHSTIRDMTSRMQIEKEWTIFDYAMRSISEAITITDEHNIIVFVNDPFLHMYGYEREELIGAPINILRIEETLPPVDEILTATLLGGWQGELINRRKDGSTFPIWLSTSVVHDENGMQLGLIGITTDITERKQAEHVRKEAEVALRASEEFFREVIENSSDIIIIVDRLGNLKYVSPSIERFLGYHPGELVGKSAFHFIHPSDIPRAIVDFGKAILTRNISIPNTFRIIHKDGSNRVLEGLGKNLLDHPSIAGFLMNVHDVTENRKAETELRESRDQLRILTVRLETIREKERKYIAREMHEEFGQILSAIKMQMSNFSRKYSHDKAFVAGIMELSGIVDAAIQSVQKISMDLRPGVFDLLGLNAAIEWLAKDFSNQYKIACSVDVPKEEIKLEEQSSIILFRLLQDALKNVADHAQASQVRICLMMGAEYVELQIDDNGIGMSEEQLKSPSSIGFVQMKERALSIGGSAEINTMEGKGTTVVIRIPFER